MIIMDIKADNFYCFKNFHLNMSYPKKIVDSSIEGEYLEDRTNFRYKKVNILMGSNATGKTSLGRLLNRFVNCCSDEKYNRFIDIISDETKNAHLSVDFVTELNRLYRFTMTISPRTKEKYTDENVSVSTVFVDIGSKDNYEMCAKKLDESMGTEIRVSDIGFRGWSFSYTEDTMGTNAYYATIEEEKYLPILEKILKTLDPSIQRVEKLEQLENAYVIRLDKKDVIIKDGELLDAKVLSSGTKAGLEISYVIASLLCDLHDLYYCDELFSYVHSEVEKACLSIIIEKLQGRKQLFFTTHNTDILDMQLPKHSFTFLKKDIREETTIMCVNAADYLKRNTDSIKCAVENDLFSVRPELDGLFGILDM